MKTRIFSAAAAFIAALAFTAAAANPAEAAGTGSGTAFGTEPIGSFSFSFEGLTINVPAGCFLTHYIQGDGLKADQENAGTDCTGAGYWFGGFCNWRIDFKYYDDHNNLYYNHEGLTISRCDYNTFGPMDNHRVLRAGRSCAVFYVAGKERARQCHNILK